MTNAISPSAPPNCLHEIAIIGGGIAGLALALNLHARAIHARVFEAAPSLREMGVGITLLPHAMPRSWLRSKHC